MAAEEDDDLDDMDFRIHRGGLLFILLVVAAILILTLLCLYVRWACSRRRSLAVAGMGAAGAGTGAQRPAGLDLNTINSFPLRVHRLSTEVVGDDAVCSICLSGLVEGDKVRVLPGCSHAFHLDCVDEWLRDMSSCPLCRAALGPSEPEPVLAAV